MRRKAVAGKPRRAHLADAEDEAHRLRREERRRLACAQHRKAARLVEIGGDLGEEFVAGQPDRNGDARASSRPRRQSAPAPWRASVPCRRSVPERSRNASSIDSGSTSGVSASIIWRTSRPTRAYFSMFGRTTRACGQSRSASNIGMAELHAVGARDVAGGGDHAAAAAADDHRLGGERRIVALFDRGVEGVAIDVGDGERAEFVVAQRCAASRSAAARRLRERRRRGSRGRRRSRHVALPVARRARCGRARPRPDRSRRCRQTRSGDSRRRAYAPARRRESRARARRRGSGPARFRSMARKRPSRSGSSAMKRKRLNRQHFGRFPRRSQRRFSCGSICLSVIYRH